MNEYNTKALFLSNLKELETSLSSVAELITTPSSVDYHSAESSIIQFKVTENVRMTDTFLYLIKIIKICDKINRWDRLTK